MFRNFFTSTNGDEVNHLRASRRSVLDRIPANCGHNSPRRGQILIAGKVTMIQTIMDDNMKIPICLQCVESGHGVEGVHYEIFDLQ